MWWVIILMGAGTISGICIDAHRKRLKYEDQLRLRKHIYGRYHQ